MKRLNWIAPPYENNLFPLNRSGKYQKQSDDEIRFASAWKSLPAARRLIWGGKSWPRYESTKTNVSVKSGRILIILVLVTRENKSQLQWDWWWKNIINLARANQPGCDTKCAASSKSCSIPLFDSDQRIGNLLIHLNTNILNNHQDDLLKDHQMNWKRNLRNGHQQQISKNIMIVSF